MKDEMESMPFKWGLYWYTTRRIGLAMLVTYPEEMFDIEARFHSVAAQVDKTKHLSDPELVAEAAFRQDPILAPVMERIDDFEADQIERFGCVIGVWGDLHETLRLFWHSPYICERGSERNGQGGADNER